PRCRSLHAQDRQDERGILRLQSEIQRPERSREVMAAPQTSEILKALREGDRLTPLDALDRFGCLRLGARIWDLRHKSGIDVKSETVELDNGKKVARYYLENPVPEQGELDLGGR